MKKLLIIRFSALGDVAMLVPVVRAFSEEHPELAITVLSQVRMADLFAQMPKNVQFLGVDWKRESLREVANELGSFDYVADVHGVWRSWYIGWRMRLRGARVRTIRKGRLAKWLLTHGVIRRPLKHTSERYAQTILDSCLVLFKSYLPLIQPLSDDSKKGIGIAPFAAHRGKVYPLERMEEVIAMLSERGEKIVLFGSKAENAVLGRWAEKYPNVESAAGQKSLAEELEIMRGLRVMISMDSANMHLASLVGTRVVSVWGATHPNAGFLGLGQSEDDCVQRETKCRPCSVYGNKGCKFGDYRCLDIRPEEIVARV